MINLEELVITHTEVTDQGLRHFAKLTQLVHLDLSATRIRGPGLACLKEASGLEWLEVSNTQLDDSAMPHIVDNFKRLKRLSFNHTDVTPKGLMELAKLPWLVVSLPDDIVGPDDREMTSRDEREELLKERRKAKRELLAQYWSAHLKFRQEARAAGIDVPPASSDGVVYDQIQWLKSEK